MISDDSLISRGIKEVRKSIEEACLECGRDSSEITICAVSKTKPFGFIECAISAGISNIGENYVQEIITKFSGFPKPPINLRMIGHLQTNKVKAVLPFVDTIDSVDSLRLINKIEKEATILNKKIKVLFELNSSFDKNKTGFQNYDDLRKAIDLISDCKFIQFDGFMTMGPLGGNEDRISKSFEYFTEIVSRIKSEYKKINVNVLSFGMSDDYKIAIKYGSNMIRVGRAIFGERQYN